MPDQLSGRLVEVNASSRDHLHGGAIGGFISTNEPGNAVRNLSADAARQPSSILQYLWFVFLVYHKNLYLFGWLGRIRTYTLRINSALSCQLDDKPVFWLNYFLLAVPERGTAVYDFVS